MREYLRYLDRAPLPDDQAAKIYYLVATLQMEQLGDYEAALASLIAARRLDPRGPLDKEIGRRMVTCLERLGRSADAARRLARETSPKQPATAPTPPPDQLVVARIGDRPVTWEEVLADWRRTSGGKEKLDLDDEAVRRDLVRAYVARELLFDSAKRKGYDRDPEVLRQADRLIRSLAVNRLYKEEVADKVQPTEKDLELYYDANKERFRAPKSEESGEEGAIRPFSEVRRQVERLYRREKEEELYQALIERLLQAEKVVLDHEAIANVAAS